MNRTTRTLVVLAVALGSAALASYGVYAAIQRIPVREVEVAHVQAVVAARAVPVGTLLRSGDVKLVPWPSRHPVPGSFSETEKVLNRGVIVSVAENEPITEDKLAPIEAGAGLPPTILPGMRAVSVKVDEVVGVAGFVVPGTRVDVLVSIRQNQQRESMSRVVVSNVQVLTAGTRIDQEKAQRDGQPMPSSVVTLMVTPQDSEKISLASAEGRIMLALRNPLDVQPTETPGVRLGSLLGPAAPPPVQRVVQGRRVMTPAAPPAAAPKPYTVETIRAAKRSEEVVR